MALPCPTSNLHSVNDCETFRGGSRGRAGQQGQQGKDFDSLRWEAGAWALRFLGTGEA